jgi:hypothetical protein
MAPGRSGRRIRFGSSIDSCETWISTPPKDFLKFEFPTERIVAPRVAVRDAAEIEPSRADLVHPTNQAQCEHLLEGRIRDARRGGFRVLDMIAVGPPPRRMLRGRPAPRHPAGAYRQSGIDLDIDRIVQAASADPASSSRSTG